LGHASGAQLHQCPDGIAIGFRADELESKPVMAQVLIIPEQ